LKGLYALLTCLFYGPVRPR